MIIIIIKYIINKKPNASLTFIHKLADLQRQIFICGIAVAPQTRRGRMLMDIYKIVMVSNTNACREIPLIVLTLSITGRCISVSAGPEVWAAPMSDGSIATVLFNRANYTLDLTVDFKGIYSLPVRPLIIKQVLNLSS